MIRPEGVVMESVLAWVAAHRKLLAVIFGAALTVAIQIWGTSNPYVSLGILAATSLGVYRVPNEDAAGAARRQAGTGPDSPPPGPVITVPATRNAGVPGAPPSAAPSEVAGTGQASVIPPGQPG
jgi:hypothetical protein